MAYSPYVIVSTFSDGNSKSDCAMTRSSITQRKTSDEQHLTFHHHEDDEVYQSLSDADVADLVTNKTPPLTPTNVMQLQRKLGNRATLIIINRQPKGQPPQTNSVPFAGMKMVIPGAIQRDPSEDEGGAITRQDDIDEADVNDPAQAVELDGSDDEVKQDSNEIDQTISEAQQLQGTIPDANANENDNPMIISADSFDSDYDDDDDMKISNDLPAPSKTVKAQGVSVDDDGIDEYNNDDDSDGATAVNPVVASKIKQQKQHKKQMGTHIYGHQLAADSPLAAIKQGKVDAGRNATTGIQIAEATAAIKSASSLNDALSSVSDTSTDAGSDGVGSTLEKLAGIFEVPPINVLLPVAQAIFRIHAVIVKRKHMKAFKALMGNNKGDVKQAKKSKTALADKGAIGAYGYAKTKRGFWLRVIKAAISIGQLIARMITLITGGTATLISEAVTVAGSLSQGVIKVGQSLKGIYKMVMGKRGKRRLEGANWIVDAALDGDQEMLQFLVDGGALSKSFLFMREQAYKNEAEVSTDKIRLKKLEIMSKRPKTADEMKTYLETAEDLNILTLVKSQVAIMTKST